MAIGTNMFTQYETVGLREDLIDVITNITPVDTWFQSTIGSGVAKQKYHEWQADVLASPAANIQIEGNQWAATAITPTVRTGNYCQILGKAFLVAESQEDASKAGRSSEVNYQKANKLKELANDIEYALIVNSSSAAGASGTARQLKGLAGWISTNVSTGTGTGNEILTESMLLDNLQLIWAAGGKPSNSIMGSFQKRKIDGFTTNTRNINADQKKLVSTISVYESAFGIISLRLHHVMETSLPGYVITLGDLGLWKKAWYRPLKWKQLPYTGFGEFWAVEAELTLESRQQKGSGMLTELTTS